MLARSNKIVHPLGNEVETPLLVPSFSSKGFAFKSKVKKNHHDVSEVTEALAFSKEFLTESLLVSAYDLFYDHIPYKESILCTEFTLIDSGGYECGNSYDLSTTSKYNYDLKQWDINQFHEVLKKWPQHKAGIIVSFDHGNYKFSLPVQINSAKELFAKYPKMLNNFFNKARNKRAKFYKD